MISSVNSLATHAVTVLTGQRRAAVPVEPVAPIKIVRRRTGHTDDVFKAGHAIGSMIAIASRIGQPSLSDLGDPAYGIKDPGIDAAMVDTGKGTGDTLSDADLQERGLEAARRHAAGTGPLAEWARAYLDAQEKRRES